MLTCCSFPTESVRVLVLLALLVFETVWLTKKDRRTALIMAAGCTLDLISAFGVPMLEMAGLYLMGQSTNREGFVVFGLITMPMMQRLSMALHLTCILVGLARLTRDLPDEEREGSW